MSVRAAPVDNFTGISRIQVTMVVVNARRPGRAARGRTHMTRSRARNDRGAARLDPRLLIGIVLVAASAVGTWGLVTSLDDGRDAAVARVTLTPGVVVSADEVRSESVRLGVTDEHYLSPEDLADGGLVTTRTIGAGELIPRSAVADEASTDLATVVVQSRGALPSTTGPGSIVDVWTARPAERDTFEPPVVLVAGAEVVALTESDSMLASSGATVELLVPRAKVAAVLEAITVGATVDLVPSGTAGTE